MDMTTQFYGVHTALATPMTGGAIDWDGLHNLVEHQLKGGIDGLVAVGTTGESPTLSHAEHLKVVTEVARQAGGQVPVLAGTGSNATEEAKELTQAACKLSGVTGALVVAPYYNKPNQEGLLQHFKAVASVTDKPIILYSIPGRCGIEIAPETCARLHEACPNICGIKEAGGRSARVAAIRQAAGESFLILSGDDGLTLPFMSLGAKGVISVASNLVVGDLVNMVRLALGNDFAGAAAIEQRYHAVFDALFCEPNPVPIKAALKRAGIIADEAVRLPLVPMAEGARRHLLSALEAAGL
jgi:4-hydroxy-tetrahydrodipicolinate synthase